MESVKAFHDKNPTLLASLGEAQLALGDYESAVNNVSALCRLVPGNVWAHYQLARAYSGAGNGKRFESELLAVLQLDDSHYPARFNLARY
jgi:Flp pilus assembly protein TadD